MDRKQIFAVELLDVFKAFDRRKQSAPNRAILFCRVRRFRRSLFSFPQQGPRSVRFNVKEKRLDNP